MHRGLRIAVYLYLLWRPPGRQPAPTWVSPVDDAGDSGGLGADM